MRINLTVNGTNAEVEVGLDETLLEVLRDRLALTGAKRACDGGECGACTVVLDGRTVNACLVLAVAASGRTVATVEGLGRIGALHPLQRAFHELGAAQCGFCTPGMLLSAAALLESRPNPSREEIRRAISGNLCRCTGYLKIIDAIASVADAVAPVGAARRVDAR